MKKHEIKVGGIYIAKVASNITQVRVDSINELPGRSGGSTYSGIRAVKATMAYGVTNLKTGRKTTFHSSAKFRSEVKPKLKDNLTGCGKPTELKCSICGAKAYSTPTGWQCSAYSNHKNPEDRALTAIIEDAIARGVDPMAFEEHHEQCCKYEPKTGQLRCQCKCHGEYKEPTGGQHGPIPMPDNEPAVQIPTDAELGLEGEKRSDPTINGKAHNSSDTAPSVTATPSETAPANGPSAKLSEVFAPPPVRSADWLNSVAGYTPTEEQKEILKLADELQRSTADGRVMVIAAGAGTGKTSTLRMLETILTGLGQYTAFNAALVAESRAKFKKAACNTTHSLAFKTVGKLYSHRLNTNRVRSEQVARMLGIEGVTINVPDPKNPGMEKPKMLDAGFLAGQVMQAVRKFCQSAEREVEAKHFRYIDGIDSSIVGEQRRFENNNTVVEYLLPFAKAAWADLSNVDGKLPFSHDVYVKVWQLGEGAQKPYIAASYILLDEAQDTAPVLLDILKQQTHALVILVGDDNQQIYDWRGAVNAMGAYPGAPRRLLSQSFRFGQAVADVANSILATLEKPTDLVMKGFLKTSRVAATEKPTCILCRTNAMAIGKFLGALAIGGKPFIVGGSAETISFCKAAVDLQAGRATQHPELSCFESWTEVQAYVKTDEGEDLKLMVKLVTDFGAKVIIDALEKMPAEKDADLVVSTAHRSKGREWRSVKLAQDFPPTTRMSDSDRRLLYVAVTRAQHTLDISECPPFCGGRSKTTGEELSALNIRYTVSMPSVEALTAYETAKVEVLPVPVAAQVPKIIAVQKAENGWVPAPDKPRDTEFTWTKHGNGYVIRGPQGHENQTVTVHRRNGTTQTVRIGAAFQKTDTVWLYGV